MKTIYQKIEDAVKSANIKGVHFKEDYPKDFIIVDEELTEDEESDTMTPLVKALSVVTEVLRAEGTSEDDIRVCFCHLPSEEYWGISIGDGR